MHLLEKSPMISVMVRTAIWGGEAIYCPQKDSEDQKSWVLSPGSKDVKTWQCLGGKAQALACSTLSYLRITRSWTISGKTWRKLQLLSQTQHRGCIMEPHSVLLFSFLVTPVSVFSGSVFYFYQKENKSHIFCFVSTCISHKRSST